MTRSAVPCGTGAYPPSVARHAVPGRSAGAYGVPPGTAEVESAHAAHVHQIAGSWCVLHQRTPGTNPATSPTRPLVVYGRNRAQKRIRGGCGGWNRKPCACIDGHSCPYAGCQGRRRTVRLRSARRRSERRFRTSRTSLHTTRREPSKTHIGPCSAPTTWRMKSNICSDDLVSPPLAGTGGGTSLRRVTFNRAPSTSLRAGSDGAWLTQAAAAVAYPLTFIRPCGGSPR